MGRRRKSDRDLPARVYLKHAAYYYVDPSNRWTRLASEGDKAAMYAALATLIGGQPAAGMKRLFDRYEAEILPRKALKTRREQESQMRTLRAVFEHMEPGDITSPDVAEYLDTRGLDAPSMANREIALLSHIFTKAIRWGLVERNPCTGVERNRETPRDRYVTDAEYLVVYEQASPILKVLMDLALLTGQRQADLLKIKLSDFSPDGIYFRQNKRGAKLIVQWSDDLRAVVDRSLALQTKARSLYLVAQANGQPYKSSGVQTAWQRLIRQCFESGVISERFTFHDIRAKAQSDGEDKRLLGHANPDAMARIYQRKPVLVKPVK